MRADRRGCAVAARVWARVTRGMARGTKSFAARTRCAAVTFVPPRSALVICGESVTVVAVRSVGVGDGARGGGGGVTATGSPWTRRCSLNASRMSVINPTSD